LVNSTTASSSQTDTGFPGWRSQQEANSFFFGLGGNGGNGYGYGGEREGGCRRERSPSLTWAKFYVGAVFAIGMAMASWVWTKPSLRVWRRFWQR
jgi:hypothetical protein